MLILPYGLQGATLFCGPCSPQSSISAVTLTPRRTWDALLCPPDTPPLIPGPSLFETPPLIPAPQSETLTLIPFPAFSPGRL